MCRGGSRTALPPPLCRRSLSKNSQIRSRRPPHSLVISSEQSEPRNLRRPSPQQHWYSLAPSASATRWGRPRACTPPKMHGRSEPAEDPTIRSPKEPVEGLRPIPRPQAPTRRAASLGLYPSPHSPHTCRYTRSQLRPRNFCTCSSGHSRSSSAATTLGSSLTFSNPCT